jgi:ketosteroid isomerase-like protein
MNNKELIHQFYTAFSQGNCEEMIEYYHENIVFQDPAFGVLKGHRARQMWEMLLSSKKSALKITFENVHATSDAGQALWIAEYFYGKRKVINKVEAKFKFEDGKIIEHIDTFDLWKWTQQAMGITGYLIGWTSFMKYKIQKTTNKKLDLFIEKNTGL